MLPPPRLAFNDLMLLQGLLVSLKLLFSKLHELMMRGHTDMNSLIMIRQSLDAAPSSHHASECPGNKKLGRNSFRAGIHFPHDAILTGRGHGSMGGKSGAGWNVSVRPFPLSLLFPSPPIQNKLAAKAEGFIPFIDSNSLIIHKMKEEMFLLLLLLGDWNKRKVFPNFLKPSPHSPPPQQQSQIKPKPKLLFSPLCLLQKLTNHIHYFGKVWKLNDKWVQGIHRI